MREETPLPFELDDITSIRMDASPNHCRVTYRPGGDMVGRKKATMRVSFDVMEQICPTFERCLRVAIVLADDLGGRGNTVSDMVKMWSYQAPAWKDRPRFILRSGVVSTSWEKPCEFAFCMHTPIDRFGVETEPEPACIAIWKDGASKLNDYRILDANFPGFSDLCQVVCIENNLTGDQAFRILSALGAALPYPYLKANTNRFKEMLRTYLPIGMDPVEIAASILSSLAISEHQDLPELSITSMA